MLLVEVELKIVDSALLMLTTTTIFGAAGRSRSRGQIELTAKAEPSARGRAFHVKRLMRHLEWDARVEARVTENDAFGA